MNLLETDVAGEHRKGIDLMSQEMRIAKLLEENAMLQMVVRWRPTHKHVKTGGLYRVTCEDRLEVTQDKAVRLVDYETETGAKFAQSFERFHDGRFKPVTGALQDYSEEALLAELLTRGKLQHAPHHIGSGGLHMMCIGIGKDEHADILIHKDAYTRLQEISDAF